MKIESVQLDSISQDPANVRQHGERNLDSITASLRAFGQQKPIVVDKRGIILAGNGTYEAARRLGWDTIKIVRTDLTGPEAVAYAIADNRTAELAEWDQVKLAEQLRALQSNGADMVAVGFSDDEITGMLDGLAGGMVGDVVDDDEEHSNSKTISDHHFQLDGVKIPITEHEFQELNDRLEAYAERHGSYFGFCAELLGISDVSI